MKKLILLAIFLLFTKTANADLVAWWKMDEASWNGTASEVVDSVGTNHGTATGGATTKVGHEQRAGYFDNVDNIVSLGKPASLTNIFSNGGTLEVWIKPNSMGEGDYGRIITKTNGTNVGWLSSTRGESGGYMQVGLTVYTSGNTGAWRTTNTIVPVGTWTHFVLTYNSSQLATDPIIYLNGQSVAVTETLTPTGTYGSDTNTNAYIGNEADYSRTFDGLIDEVKIYNHALTAAEVTQAYWEGSHTRLRNATIR